MEASDPLEDKEIAEIKKDKKVQRALSETSVSAQKGSAVTLKKEAPILGITIIIFLGCSVLYFLLGWKRLPIISTYIPLAQKIVLAVMLISLVLLATRLLKKIVDRKIEVIVRYLVEPKNSGPVKKALFESVMEELKKSPEKVILILS